MQARTNQGVEGPIANTIVKIVWKVIESNVNLFSHLSPPALAIINTDVKLLIDWYLTVGSWKPWTEVFPVVIMTDDDDKIRRSLPNFIKNVAWLLFLK